MSHTITPSSTTRGVSPGWVVVQPLVDLVVLARGPWRLKVQVTESECVEGRVKSERVGQTGVVDLVDLAMAAGHVVPSSHF